MPLQSIDLLVGSGVSMQHHTGWSTIDLALPTPHSKGSAINHLGGMTPPGGEKVKVRKVPKTGFWTFTHTY